MKTQNNNNNANGRATRARKTRDEWQVWGNYGYGWDEECAEDTRADGRKRLREYQENGGGAYQLRKRRILLQVSP